MQCVAALISSLSVSDAYRQRVGHPGLTPKLRSARVWAMEAETYLSAAIVEIKADAAKGGSI